MRGTSVVVALLLPALAMACSESEVFSLEEGTCFRGTVAGEISEVDDVECSEPHDNEVFHVFDIEGQGDDYPGVDAIQVLAVDGCVEELEPYTGEGIEEAASSGEIDVAPIIPTEETWDGGDREVVCVLTSLTGEVEGSARG